MGQIRGELVNYTSLFIVILNICKWSASLGKVRSPPKKSRCWVTIWQPESAALLPILESRTETSATDAKSQSRHHFLYPTVFSCVMDSPLRFWSLFIFLFFNWKCLLAVVLIFIQYYAKSSIFKKTVKNKDISKTFTSRGNKYVLTFDLYLKHFSGCRFIPHTAIYWTFARRTKRPPWPTMLVNFQVKSKHVI